MKKFRLFIILTLCFIFCACGKNIEASSSEKTYGTEESSVVEDSQQMEEAVSELLYFESDDVIDNFFSNYNAIAELEIPAEQIEKGNIRTKALVYIDDLSLEVINANDFLSISISTSAENESTTLHTLFRDSIKAIATDITEADIQSAWDAIHESGYSVEDYVFNDINITFVPSKELSWGISDSRVDLEIPLK